MRRPQLRSSAKLSFAPATALLWLFHFLGFGPDFRFQTLDLRKGAFVAVLIVTNSKQDRLE
jgi:hypothetical protein